MNYIDYYYFFIDLLFTVTNPPTLGVILKYLLLKFSGVNRMQHSTLIIKPIIVPIEKRVDAKSTMFLYRTIIKHIHSYYVIMCKQFCMINLLTINYYAS